MTEPIADMLARIRNAVSSKHSRVDIPASKLKLEIARILKEEGYIHNFVMKDQGTKRVIRIFLRYDVHGTPSITHLSQVSKLRNADSTSSKNLHVIHREDNWAILREGNLKPTSLYDTQVEAVEAARKLAKKEAGQLIVHGRSGRIVERDSYRHDPWPPMDRKVLHPSAPPRTTNRAAISKAVTEALRDAESAS